MTSTTRHLAIAGGFLHLAGRATPDSSSLDYDWDDFAGEFANIAAGRDRYKIDERMDKFLTHFGSTQAGLEKNKEKENDYDDLCKH